MTAVWRSGAEIAPHTASAEFSGGSLANASTSTTIKRSGDSSLKYTGIGYSLSPTGLNLTGAALRAYVYISGTPSANSRVVGFQTATGQLATLRINTARALVFLINGPPIVHTSIATSTFTIPIGSFVCLELWVDKSTGIVATRYNGVEWARSQVTFAASGNIDSAWFGPDQATMGVDIYYDDMAINSLAGSYNNGWPGPSAGGVLTFRPNISSTPAGWTLNGAPTAHECLDDLAPDTTTTCIIQAGGASGSGASVALYFPAWPLSVPVSSLHIGMNGYADTTSSIALDIRDPVNAQSVAFSTLVPSWTTARYPFVTLERAWDGTRRLLNNGYLMPASGARWIVVIVRTDGIAAVQYVSTLWMTVDFPLALAPPPAAAGAAPALGFGSVSFGAYPFGAPTMVETVSSIPSPEFLITVDP